MNPLGHAVVSGLQQESPALLRVTGGDGRVLREHPAEVVLSSERRPSDDRAGIVSAVIPVEASARSIELVLNEQVVDTYPVGGALPGVVSLRAQPAGEGLAITGTVEQTPERAQTYSIQISTDGGTTWQTIGTGLKDLSVNIDRSQFQAGQEVQVRVIATNGLVASVERSETVSL